MSWVFGPHYAAPFDFRWFPSSCYEQLNCCPYWHTTGENTTKFGPFLSRQIKAVSPTIFTKFYLITFWKDTGQMVGSYNLFVSQIKPEMEYWCHTGVALSSFTVLDNSKPYTQACRGWIIFPLTTLFFPIIETPQAPRCYITISMLRVLTSSIPLFQLPWPFQLGLTMLRTRGWILFIPFVFPLSFNGTASSQGILLCKSNTGQFAFSITTILTYSSMGEPLSFLHNLTNCTLPFLSPLPNHTLTFYREWLLGLAINEHWKKLTIYA